MKYTEQSIIGLRVRHKDYKVGDHLGVYIIDYNIDGKTLGVWFYHSGASINDKLQFSDYSLTQIISNIEKGSWIPVESEVINDYQIF